MLSIQKESKSKSGFQLGYLYGIHKLGISN